MRRVTLRCQRLPAASAFERPQARAALVHALQKTLEGPRFRSSKRDRLLLRKCASQDDSKVVEGYDEPAHESARSRRSRRT